jgi:uncharacterized protein
LAAVYLELAWGLVGANYEQLKQAWQGVEVGPRERKLALGLQKLIEDRCELQANVDLDPRELRSRLFVIAASERRAQGRQFDRGAVLEQLTAHYQTTAESLDAALYADLPSQHVLQKVPASSAEELVRAFDLAQYQAVLLRAVKVRAEVRCKDPARYRGLFRALKFHRLLFTMQRGDAGYLLEIDGPFSLFDSVTKYGLQLAIVFPLLCECDELKLSADLRWGKARTPLRFEYQGKAAAAAAEALVELGQEAAQLLAGVNKLDSEWRAELNPDILDLPGIGLCVPDLCLRSGKLCVYVELMGFWSRDAVWKRIELVEQGLSAPVVFAVSSRLRVSEAALDDAASSALYVYKGVPQARALLEKVNLLGDKQRARALR